MPSAQEALTKLENLTADVSPISVDEHRQRLQKLQSLMKDQGIDSVYLHGGTNMFYFTGLRWHPSERMVAALIPAEGPPAYVAPRFELDTLRDYWQIEGEIHAWDEHESPFQLVNSVLSNGGKTKGGKLAVDESTPYFIVHGLQQVLSAELVAAQPLTEACRQHKSATEIEIIRRAHQATMTVIQSAASILEPGITTSAVTQYIDQAHRAVGAADGSFFCIVLFGVATSFPHGVKEPQVLAENDWVLIDTGFLLHGYNSDITRTFAFGSATDRQKEVWQFEKESQEAAFHAAVNGQPCEALDLAARRSLESNGLGPNYDLPGLPHRTGHGCGLDIHEAPFIVRGNQTKLSPGVVASIEPMIVVPGQFGVRLEDHFYMAEDGAHWFTEPARSLDDPF